MRGTPCVGRCFACAAAVFASLSGWSVTREDEFGVKARVTGSIVPPQLRATLGAMVTSDVRFGLALDACYGRGVTIFSLKLLAS